MRRGERAIESKDGQKAILERLVADCHADKLLHRFREVLISLLVQINVTDRQLFIHLVKAQRHFIWKIDDQAIRDEGRAHAPSCHVERRDNLVRFHDNIRRRGVPEGTGATGERESGEERFG